MLTVLLTTLRSLWSKVGLAGVSAVAVAVVVATVALKVFNAGVASERLVQATETLNTHKKDQAVEADIDAISAAAARKRLLDRWSRR